MLDNELYSFSNHRRESKFNLEELLNAFQAEFWNGSHWLAKVIKSLSLLAQANENHFEIPSQILDSFQVLKSNLLDTASLMKNYEKICQRFKFNQSHLFLRPIAPSLGKPSGSDVSKIKGRSVPPDDRTVDRFKPSHYSIAINDYDEDVLKNVKAGIENCSLLARVWAYQKLPSAGCYRHILMKRCPIFQNSQILWHQNSARKNFIWQRKFRRCTNNW